MGLVRSLDLKTAGEWILNNEMHFTVFFPAADL